MRVRCVAALTCLLAWQASPAPLARATTHRHAVASPTRGLSGRVDSLLPTPGGTVPALIGRPGSRVRLLPRDTLAIVTGAGLRSVALPPYMAAPGLAASPDGMHLYALVDNTLLTLSGSAPCSIASRDLHPQAIGWPAAVTAGPNGDLYLIGQPAGAMEAPAYAFRVGNGRIARQVWRVALGLTHAGAWVGMAGDDQLAVYLPNQSDTRGDVALLARNGGTLRRSYAVPLAPIASNGAQDRLYLAGAGIVRALVLHSGAPAASAAGDAPLAVDEAHGLVAFVRDRRVVVARGDTLTTILTFPFPDRTAVTARAWQGPALLVGSARGITRMQLEG